MLFLFSKIVPMAIPLPYYRYRTLICNQYLFQLWPKSSSCVCDRFRSIVGQHHQQSEADRDRPPFSLARGQHMTKWVDRGTSLVSHHRSTECHRWQIEGAKSFYRPRSALDRYGNGSEDTTVVWGFNAATGLYDNRLINVTWHEWQLLIND